MKAMKKIGNGVEEGDDVDEAEKEFDEYANGFDRYDDEDSTAQSLVQKPGGKKAHKKPKKAKKAHKKKEGDLDQAEPKVPANIPKNVGATKGDPDDAEDAKDTDNGKGQVPKIDKKDTGDTLEQADA